MENSKIKIVIVGAGGHGKEVAQILAEQYANDSKCKILGFIDENINLHGKKINNLPVLGGISWLEEHRTDSLRVICAVGNPKIMKMLVDKINQQKIEFINAIHPQAYIAPNAKIGKGVIIFQNTSISVDTQIGNYVTINVSSSISHDCIIEDYSNINPRVSIAGNVHVGALSFIGMGSSIIQGISIGSQATVGAGSVIIRNIPSNSLAVGVPAKVIKTIK